MTAQTAMGTIDKGAMQAQFRGLLDAHRKIVFKVSAFSGSTEQGPTVIPLFGPADPIFICATAGTAVRTTAATASAP